MVNRRLVNSILASPPLNINMTGNNCLAALQRWPLSELTCIRTLLLYTMLLLPFQCVCFENSYCDNNKNMIYLAYLKNINNK